MSDERVERPPAPPVLVAHRCDEHRSLAPLNIDAALLVMYQAEQRPRAFPLGATEHAECGGCLADQVEALYQMNLDLLDVLADVLTSRAELRRELTRRDRFGL